MSRATWRWLRRCFFALLGIAAGAIGVALRGPKQPPPVVQQDRQSSYASDVTIWRSAR